VQALLDVIGVPYTGSGMLGSALAFDKDMAKHVLRDAGVRVPAWVMAPASAEAVSRSPGFPCVVKPSNEGSSVGLSLVREPAALDPAIRLATRYDSEVMIEEYVEGTRADRRHHRRPRASGDRDHRQARIVRLRMQVHAGHGRRIRGETDARARRGASGCSVARPPRAQARLMLVRNFR